MAAWERLRGEAVTEMMLDLAKIHVGDRVLELAAGMGDLAIMTARLVGPNGYVLATDISANMLDLAAETVREAGFTNVETRVMDAENLDVAPDSFNVALCRFGLMLFPDAAKALAGVYRALKPAGRFAVTVWSTAEKNPFHGLPLAIASRLAKVPLPAPGQPGLFALSGQGVLEECYTKAGFLEQTKTGARDLCHPWSKIRLNVRALDCVHVIAIEPSTALRCSRR